MTHYLSSLSQDAWIRAGLYVLAATVVILFSVVGSNRAAVRYKAGSAVAAGSTPPLGAAARVQAVLDSVRTRYALPGATAAYVSVDGASGVAATGWADVEAKRAMTPTSRMLAASIGKTFVAATAVTLALEGAVDLDAPIARWLNGKPWFTTVPNRDAITLRHLLAHRSGLPDHVHLDAFVEAVSRRWNEPGNPFPPDTLVQFVLQHPALFDPGDGWAYSDTGYILAGMVLEDATGMDYYDLVQERFLTPLALRETEPSNMRDLANLASGYSPGNAFGWPSKSTRTDGTLAWHPGIEWTGGGLVSTSADLALWGAALFGGDALPGAALTQMLRAEPLDPAEPDVRYGLGVAVHQSERYGSVYGHSGWIPGYVSSLRYYADYGIAIAFQINTDVVSEGDMGDAVRTLERRLANAILPVSSVR